MLEENEVETTKGHNKRPFLLTLACLFSFTYNGLLGLLLLTGLFCPHLLSNTLTTYISSLNQPFAITILSLILGLVLFGLTFTGALYIWKLRKVGLYIYIPSKIIYLLLVIITGNSSLYQLSLSLILFVIFLSYIKRLN